MNKKIIIDAFNKLPLEINEAEIALEAQENYNFEVGNDGINNISYSNSEEHFVRVSNDSEGYYYTQDGSEDPYKMFIKAYENSLVSSVKRTSVYNHNYCDSSNNTKQYNLIDLKVYYIWVNDKERLLRQLNREYDPDVKEIIRRYSTDEQDFAHLEDIDFEVIINQDMNDLAQAVDLIMRAN